MKIEIIHTFRSDPALREVLSQSQPYVASACRILCDCGRGILLGQEQGPLVALPSREIEQFGGKSPSILPAVFSLQPDCLPLYNRKVHASPVEPKEKSVDYSCGGFGESNDFLF